MPPFGFVVCFRCSIFSANVFLFNVEVSMIQFSLFIHRKFPGAEGAIRSLMHDEAELLKDLDVRGTIFNSILDLTGSR